MNKLMYFFFALKKRGFRFIIDYFRESIWFDLRFGTSTSSRVAKDFQTIKSSTTDHDNGLLYVASFTSVIKKTVEIAHQVIGSDRSCCVQFLDLGCGKGKALLVYTLYFGSLSSYQSVGIEYDPNLVALANKNILKTSFSRDSAFVVLDSATNVRSYVESSVAIIYLYNSFQGQTLKSTLLALQGLPHVLIYVDPAQRDVIACFDYRIVAEHQGLYNADTWLVACSKDLLNSRL